MKKFKKRLVANNIDNTLASKARIAPISIVRLSPNCLYTSTTRLSLLNVGLNNFYQADKYYSFVCWLSWLYISEPFAILAKLDVRYLEHKSTERRSFELIISPPAVEVTDRQKKAARNSCWINFMRYCIWSNVASINSILLPSSNVFLNRCINFVKLGISLHSSFHILQFLHSQYLKKRLDQRFIGNEGNTERMENEERRPAKNEGAHDDTQCLCGLLMLYECTLLLLLFTGGSSIMNP